MDNYVKLKDVLHILDLVITDDSIKHTGKAIRKRLKELPTEDVDNKELHRLIDIAVEKQMPKKVTKSVCPPCNRIFLFKHGETRKGNYCDNCGQALDWSDAK